MKTKSILIAIFTFVVATAIFAKNEKVVFNVAMDCQACQQKIEKNIAFEKGVKGLDVDLKANLVTVTYKASKTNIAKLQEGFKKIGYEAVEQNAKPCCADKGKTDCKQTCTDDKKSTKCDSK